MKCIVIHKNMGIFGALLDLNDGDDPVMMFTKDDYNKYPLKAVTVFQNPLFAKGFIEEHCVDDEDGVEDFVIKPILSSKTNIASYMEVIRSGYAEHAGYMIESVDMVNDKIH